MDITRERHLVHILLAQPLRKYSRHGLSDDLCIKWDEIKSQAAAVFTHQNLGLRDGDY